MQSTRNVSAMSRLAGKVMLFGISALLCLTVFCSKPVFAGTSSPRSGPNRVSMEFDDVDIKVFVKFISKLTGKNFVLDKSVKGTINVISPTKLTPDEAYGVFESVLEVYGFTTIPSGSVIKIVPLRTAKDKGVRTLIRPSPSPASSQDRMVTQLIPLKYAKASDLQRILGPLVSKSSVITAHPESNTLIVTDIQSNIQRLVRIIAEIDVPGVENRISVMELRYAPAPEVAKKIIALMGERRNLRVSKMTRERKTLKVIPVEWFNALVVLANREDTREIRKLIHELDRPTPEGRDNIHVYYLKNAVAEDLAKVLNQVREKGTRSNKGQKRTTPVISRNVSLTPDRATNSLVIRATPQEYEKLVKIIKKLDIPRPMVYVEGLIMEVTTDKALRLGVEWHAGNDFDNQEAFWFGGSTAGAGGTLGSIFSGIQNENPTFALPGGLALGVIGKALSYGGITFPSYSALINAIRTDEDFNILSTPQILTTDNVEAEVRVAENIPFQTRLDEGTDVTSRAISTFEYKDVGVVLKVTPQINQNRFVRLKIEQEVRNVLRESTRDSRGNLILAPVTNVRSTKTTVIVKDGETVVLGGLIQDLERGNESRVPCLGNIPVVGWAFRTQSRKKGKTNLLVFLTPHIIETPEEMRALSEGKNREIRNAVSKQKSKVRRLEGKEEKADHEKPKETGTSGESRP